MSVRIILSKYATTKSPPISTLSKNLRFVQFTEQEKAKNVHNI